MERRTSHLTKSPLALRVAATLMTAGTLLGSAMFAAGHVYNPAAPLKPVLTTMTTAATTTMPLDGEDDDDAPRALGAVPRTTTVTPGAGTTPRPALTGTGQS